MVYRLLALSLLLTSVTLAQSTTLFSRETDWGKIVVRESAGQRILLFSSKSGETEESRMTVSEPYRPHLKYVKQMLALTALWEAQPEREDRPYRFLVVGLGGASLSTALSHLFAEAEITSLEIEPAVVEAAKRFFFYRETALVTTEVGDARDFLERNTTPYDLIFLDAFDGQGVPEHLRTLDFAQLVERNLTPHGGVIANIHFVPRQPSLRYQQSLRSVFRDSFMLQSVAQGVGLYTHHPLSSIPLVERYQEIEKRYRLPISELLKDRHQESLEGVEPFRDNQ